MLTDLIKSVMDTDGLSIEEDEASVPPYKWAHNYDKFMDLLEDHHHIFERFPLERVTLFSATDRAKIGRYPHLPTLSYSEIDYESFGMLLMELQDFELPSNASYFDLGCGVVRKTLSMEEYLFEIQINQ